jgi:hypothetical protein
MLKGPGALKKVNKFSGMIYEGKSYTVKKELHRDVTNQTPPGHE